jgi:hypothetical protein
LLCTVCFTHIWPNAAVSPLRGLPGRFYRVLSRFCPSKVLSCSVLLAVPLVLFELPLTGSEGIGKAVAAGLAAQGVNVVLVSRSQAKLDAAAQDIQQHWPQTKVPNMAVRCKPLVFSSVYGWCITGCQHHRL